MNWLDTWDGYLPPTSNTTYTPNQFFDVVLPYASRGVLRLVAYLIRKTLGWSDAYGRPQNPHVRVSYRELERQAGIARSMLRPAIDEALEARYIECVQEGRPDRLDAPAETALYKLKWDARHEYITDREDFQGFFAGNGNLTYIPNQFFDITIPQEPLAVIKVVGTIIRHTIGWQTEYGFRRQQVAMSFSELQERTGLSRQSINVALHTALDHRHVTRVEAGTFHADTAQQKTAVYGIKWHDDGPKGPLSPQVTTFKAAPARKVDQETEEDRLEKLTREPARKVDQHRLEKLTSTGSKSLPENRLEKLTSIKITDQEIKPSEIKEKKQQQQKGVEPGLSAADFLIQNLFPSLFQSLLDHGVNRADAQRLANTFPEECARQLEYLPYKTDTFTVSKGAYLRRAIEQGFAPPKAYIEARAQKALADRRAAEQQNLADRQDRQKRHAGAYAVYLGEQERRLRLQHPQVYELFEQEEQRQREVLVKGPGSPTSLIRRKALEYFDSEAGHQERLIRYFLPEKEYGILTFDQWEASFCPDGSVPPNHHKVFDVK